MAGDPSHHHQVASENRSHDTDCLSALTSHKLAPPMLTTRPKISLPLMNYVDEDYRPSLPEFRLSTRVTLTTAGLECSMHRRELARCWPEAAMFPPVHTPRNPEHCRYWPTYMLKSHDATRGRSRTGASPCCIVSNGLFHLLPGIDRPTDWSFGTIWKVAASGEGGGKHHETDRGNDSTRTRPSDLPSPRTEQATASLTTATPSLPT